MGTKRWQMRRLWRSISLGYAATTRSGRFVWQGNPFTILCCWTGARFLFVRLYVPIRGRLFDVIDAILQEIRIEVELTANHQGHFELYLCPNNNPLVEADQDCFDRYPLQVVGQDDHLYIIPNAEKKGTFR